MLRVYSTPFSTNVERVALALERQRLDGRHPRLEDWIARLNALPRA